MKVIVVGGGIGGLAAAVGLRRVGIESVVLERAPAIREVGAGLSMWSNAALALERLGVAGRLSPRATRIDRVITRTEAGETLDEVSLVEIARRAGAVSLCVHRAELQQALLEAAGPDRVRTGQTVVGFEQTEAEVAVRLEDGTTERGDALIGADGIRSAVRAQLLGTREEPRYAGYTGWRGIAPVDLPEPPTALFVVGRGTQGGIFACGPGRTYWFLTHNSERGLEDAPGSHRAAVSAVIAGWSSPFAELLAATPEEAISRHDISDRPPVTTWGAGRVTLLGDAVHPTTPNLGQGAGMALEDAVVLAHRLRDSRDVPASLRGYESERKARTAHVTTQSHRLGILFQMENALAVKLRNWLSRSDFSHAQGERTFAQLLCHDLPAL